MSLLTFRDRPRKETTKYRRLEYWSQIFYIVALAPIQCSFLAIAGYILYLQCQSFYIIYPFFSCHH
ncbi:hypothetical protein BDZ94DRAFT_1272086 [Collybia nuda]|uniref:Uncharacterized protein n=1 Tax=Collybia nuda TaxID=64659 RepID=A0A9P5XWG7_9AGAR|nr:hypothetical protein BDZ94DRAFT_1272086 [Collybia nuda]